MADDSIVGATVIVYRQIDAKLEFLILHRARSGPGFEGEWAWTPPAGHREEGESPIECAKRELFEETRLSLDLNETSLGTDRFKVFVAQANEKDAVVLDAEHDRFRWGDLQTVLDLCKPARVASDFAKVADAIRA